MNHSNIIKFVEFHEDRAEGNYVIVTEYFKSMTLEEFLSKNQNFHHQNFILRQIFEALEYIHENLTVHRDFTLSNILIEPETLLIKIIDFGLSTSLKNGDLDIAISAQGNLKYRLPDSFVFSKNPYIYDVWSAGMVAFSVFLKQKVSTGKFLKMIQGKENVAEGQNFSKTLLDFYSLVEKIMEEENSQACFVKMSFIFMKVFQK